MPEFVVSINSAINGYHDIAIGNVIGSNVANLFLILGVCALIKPLHFKRETKIFENPFTIFVTLILIILANNEVIISRIDGIILLCICVCFIIYNIVVTRNNNKTIVTLTTEKKEKHTLLKSIFNIIFGILCLKFGSDLVVDHSIVIAHILNVEERIIGLTIVAFSTCLPELITAIVATTKGETDMAIGNVLGSQIFNIVFIIGTAATLKPIEYSMAYNKELILLLIGTMMLWMFPYIKRKDYMTRWNGAVFLTIYLFYVINLVTTV